MTIERRKISGRQLVDYLHYMDRMLEKGDLTSLKATFNRHNVATEPFELSIALLRSNFMFRSHLQPAWNDLLQRFKEHLESVGEDPDEMLHGLTKE